MLQTLKPDQLECAVASLSDLSEVTQLMTELVRELDPSPTGDRIVALLPHDLTDALSRPSVRIFVARQDGAPIGLCRGDVLDHDPIFRLREDHRCGYIDQMYVRDGYRDQKVGQLLLSACERWFVSLGLRYTLLHSAPKAVRFYARCGYQPNREMFKELDAG